MARRSRRLHQRWPRRLPGLADRPDLSAGDIALGIGEPDDRHVFHLLDKASYDGRCQRMRIGSDAWMWKVPPMPDSGPECGVELNADRGAEHCEADDLPPGWRWRLMVRTPGGGWTEWCRWSENEYDGPLSEQDAVARAAQFRQSHPGDEVRVEKTQDPPPPTSARRSHRCCRRRTGRGASRRALAPDGPLAAPAAFAAPTQIRAARKDPSRIGVFTKAPVVITRTGD